MNDAGLHMRCQRCGAEMEMRDPGEGTPWTPDQFWVCNKCGRHFWTTYPPPKPAAAAGTASSRGRACGSRACRGTSAISHEMSRRYVLEYPVDDPDDEDDDDVDDDG